MVKQYEHMENTGKIGPCLPLFEVAQGHRKWHGSIGYLWLSINDPP